MRRKTKWLCLLFVMTLMLAGAAGCSKGKVSEKGTGTESGSGGQMSEGMSGKGSGRFLENEITLPGKIGKILSLTKLQDGSLAVIGEDDKGESYYILKSSDKGENWEKVSVKGLPKTHIPYAAVSPDGSSALFHYAKKGRAEVTVADARGKAKTVNLQLPDKIEENQIRQAAYDKKGNLFVMDMEGAVLAVDLAKGTCREALETKGQRINYFGMAGNVMLAVHEKGIQLFDTEKGSTLDSEDILDDLIKENKALAFSDTDSGAPIVFSEGMDSGSIVFADENGIFHFNQGGSVIEQLLDASLTSLGSGNVIFQDIVAFDKNEFFIAVNDSGEHKLFRYSYDNNAASVPDKEITVYALDESSVLRKAVTMFQKKYPDIYVKLEFGLSGDDGVTLEDALSVLSTNILAGKGPDVLILDGMPADSYIEKGILADISDVVEEVDREEGVLSGIKEGSKKEGKIYAFPARFLISVIEGDKETIESGKSLAELAKRAVSLKKGKDGVIPQSKGTITLLRDLYYADSASWLTEDNSIDEKALTDYLTCAKQIYDVDSNDKKHDFQSKTGDGTAEGTKVGTLSGAELIQGTCKMELGSLADFWSLQNMVSSWQLSKADYGLLNCGKVKSYIPYLSAGVTESGNKEIAKEFVKLLLGKKAGNTTTNGFPVNKTAFDLQCKEVLDSKLVKDDGSIGFSGADGKSYSFSTINLTKQQVERFTTFVESLEKPAMNNRVILNIVLEQGDKYLLGEQNLESTVDAILKKVNLYLAENS